MSTYLTPVQFVHKLKDCIKEYKKQLAATRDDSDAAHYFDPGLKIFLKNHKNELKVLSEINFEKQFMSWLKLYLFKEDDNDRA